MNWSVALFIGIRFAQLNRRAAWRAASSSASGPLGAGSWLGAAKATTVVRTIPNDLRNCRSTVPEVRCGQNEGLSTPGIDPAT
jgi:hypothetical protein